MERKPEVCNDSGTDLIGLLQVVDIVENDDDTFTVTFDMKTEVAHALLSHVLKRAIMDYVGELNVDN